MQALVVGGFRDAAKPARGVRSVRRDRPQRDLVEHLAALVFAHAERIGVLRQQAFGSIGIALREFRQSVGRHPATAVGLRPVQRARMDRIDEGRVIVGERGFVGRQATRGTAHHAGLALGGGGLDAFPPQGRRKSALAGQYVEHRIAAIGQRLGALAPERLCLPGPCGIRATGRLARLKVGALQGDAVGRLPGGEEGGPVLAACQGGQPHVAKLCGDGLAVVAHEERLRLRRRYRIGIAAQGRQFDPSVQRMAREG